MVSEDAEEDVDVDDEDEEELWDETLLLVELELEDETKEETVVPEDTGTAEVVNEVMELETVEGVVAFVDFELDER